MNTHKGLVLVLSAVLLPLVLLTVSLSHASGRSDPANPPYAPDRVIVKLRAEREAGDETLKSLALRSEAAETALLRHGGMAVKRLFDGGIATTPATNTPPAVNAPGKRGLERVYRMQLERNKTVEGTLVELRADPNVEWAEPDYLAFPADTTPNDPLLPEQWGLAKISAPTAWDTAKGDASTVIAIVDSGIDRSHPDLAAKLWTNPGEIAVNGLDDDNNGYIDDVHGWDFVGGDNDPSDDNGHGTQAAGIAGAATDNAVGIAGVCWNCKLMSVKVMQAGGVANYSDIAAGVLYAAKKGAKVINLSLGGYGNSAALQSAVQEATDTYGAIVVAGAGNDNVSTPFYPAAYEEVLAVAGTDDGDKKSNFSNYGEWVDVSAPGESITTTFLGGDWGPANGTSFAAPFASGLAGLLRSQHADWSPALVKSQIEHTADAIDALNPTLAGKLGSGRIDANTAVVTDPHPVLEISESAVNGDPLGKPVPGQSNSMRINLSNDWLDAAGTQGVLSTTNSYVTMVQDMADYGDIPAGGSAESTPVYTFTVAAGAGYNHPIPFVLHLTANSGAYSTDINFTVTTRSADEPFSGMIDSNTTWTSDKTYLINGATMVVPGVTLTIQPGTVIKFTGNYNLTVGGTLVADGTASQPIRFLANPGVSWGRIYFENDSADAQADADGAYQSGNILRHVEIQGATEGIDCNSATPYLSHLTLGGGGVNCTLGATSLWVLDSTLAGGLTASGGGTVLRSRTIGGGISLGGTAVAWENTVAGGLTVGAGSTVMENTVEGTINAPGASQVQGNHSKGISAGVSAQVIENTVSGSLATGANATVMTNTLTGGGLSLGNNTLAHFNDIEEATGWGISAGTEVTLTMNRVVGGANGVNVSGGRVQGNLVANNTGLGLQVNGNVTVISNTLTGNSGSAIKLVSGTLIQIWGNNLEGNTGTYDIENRIPKATLMSVPASGNWWGTTSNAAIGGRIYDWNDDETFTLGQVQYTPAATEPIQNAPAYVRSVTMTPPSPVGIQTAQFDVQFSRSMDQGSPPLVQFYQSRAGSWGNLGQWQYYDRSNSTLPSDNIRHGAISPAGDVWLGTDDGVWISRKDGSTQVLKTENSGLQENSGPIAFDREGNAWFGTSAHGLNILKTDGSWEYLNNSNSGLGNDQILAPAVFDDQGNKWFATNDGVYLWKSDASWVHYLAGEPIFSLVLDSAGNLWAGTNGNGIKRISSDGSITDIPSGPIYHSSFALNPNGDVWLGHFNGIEVYKPTGTHFHYDVGTVTSIAFDQQGNAWVGDRWSGINRVHPDGSWENFSIQYNDVLVTLVDQENNVWAGSLGGVSVNWGFDFRELNVDPHWSSPTTYHAGYEITSLIPRADYLILIRGAAGVDQLEIAPHNVFTFTVDYAGSISDMTPPFPPAVTACGSTTRGTVSASWTAHDADSAITLYRYAIGTTSGGTDIVNWTTISSPSFTRTGLGLTAGQKVYISVMARNDAGLWSTPSTPPAITAGSATCTTNSNYSLSLAPATQVKSGNAGTAVTYSLAVTNTGDTTDNFTVAVNSPWTASAPATVGPLPPGESASFDVHITIPTNAAGGVPNQATVTVTSQADSAAHSQAILTTTANPMYQVSLTPSTATQSGNPGSTVTYNLTVKNTGNTSDSFTVAVSSPWTANAPATVGPVASGGSAALNVSVTLPSSAAGGASSQATVTVTSQANTAVKAQATLTTTANPTYQVSLTPATATKSGSPGGTVTYNLSVNNTGSASDSFSVAVNSPWTANAPATVGPVAAGGSTALNVSITVPADAVDGASNQAVVTVTSQAAPSVKSQATLTTAVNPVYQFSLAPATLAQSGNPGSAVIYSLTVTNQGNTIDTFDVLVNSPWAVTVPLSIGPIASGGSMSLYISIAIPAGTANGASTQAAVTVKSQGNPAIQAQATLTTTVTTTPLAQSKLYIPIVRK